MIIDRMACERQVRKAIEDPENMDQATKAVLALAKAVDLRCNRLEDRVSKIEKNALDYNDVKKAIRRGNA